MEQLTTPDLSPIGGNWKLIKPRAPGTNDAAPGCDPGLGPSRGPRWFVAGGLSQSTKLTATQVREIKRDLRKGHRNIDISHAYGIHHNTISAIKNGRTWRHVSEVA